MLSESINPEEEEVRKLLCECLDLRNSYVYGESVAPWTKVVVAESSTSGVKTDPFYFEPVPATLVSYFLFLSVKFSTYNLLCVIYFSFQFPYSQVKPHSFFFDVFFSKLLCSITLGWKMELHMFMPMKMVSSKSK